MLFLIMCFATDAGQTDAGVLHCTAINKVRRTPGATSRGSRLADNKLYRLLLLVVFRTRSIPIQAKKQLPGLPSAASCGRGAKISRSHA